MFLACQGHDVRDVNPNRTSEQARHRRNGTTDALDSVRVERANQAKPATPIAFKRADGDAGPDETHELISFWHKARRSILTSREHLVNEAENLLGDLPEEIRFELPNTPNVRSRLRALARRTHGHWDPATTLRLELLERQTAAIADLNAPDRHAAKQLRDLAELAGSTLHELCGLAPLPVSSAEGAGEPVRHRLNRGGNRRVNACLNRMAITQLRCEPRARKIYNDARATGHTNNEAMRILKRQLSNLVHLRMIRDVQAHRTPQLATRLT
jgi:hypothetical protein